MGLAGEVSVTRRKGSSGKGRGEDKEAAKRAPGGGNGNPLQYSCLENPTERGAWWATVRGAANSWTRLSD